MGHILLRNCLVKQFIERWQEDKDVTSYLEDLTETGWYWNMKEVSLECTLWGTHFGWSCWPVVRQTTKWMNEWPILTSARADNVLLLCVYLCCTGGRSISFCISASSAASGALLSISLSLSHFPLPPSVFLLHLSESLRDQESFIAEEVYGVGDKGWAM